MIEKMKQFMSEKITCADCWKVFVGEFSHFWWGISAQGKFDAHKKACEAKQQLLKDIQICKTQARIFECLNCQRYQKECSWMSQR